MHNDSSKSLIYKVLDSFVEPVRLIHKKQGAASARLIVFRLTHRLADFLDAGKNGGKREEFAVKAPRHEPRQRGFAHARRPPENHGMRLPRREREIQRLSLPQQMTLSHDFVQRDRAQPFRQRRARAEVCFSGKKVGGHGGIKRFCPKKGGKPSDKPGSVRGCPLAAIPLGLALPQGSSGLPGAARAASYAPV